MTERPVISVSEDRLEGVMAKFELRMRDFITEALVHKADLVMLTEARKTIANHEDRFTSLEQWRAGALTLSTFQRWLVGTVLVVLVAAVITGAATLVSTHLH